MQTFKTQDALRDMSRQPLGEDSLEAQFRNPAPIFRPQPFWFLNHRLEKPELEQQIEAMHKAGVGGVVLHARHGMQSDFLSDEFMDALEFSTEECRKRNMVVWLYDEDNWPSGTVGGKLTRQYPEYRMRYLRVEERRLPGGGAAASLKLDFASYEHQALIAILAYRAIQRDGEWLLCSNPENITGFLNQEWVPKTDDPYVILACWSCEIAEGMTFAQGYYLDTLNPEAVQAFIRLSYEPLLRLKGQYGKTIQGVFTDEPGLMIHDGFFGVEAIRTDVHNVQATLPGMVFAWSHGMVERFRDENGYDPIPHLGALLYGMADGSRSFRQQYYETITRWYVGGYHAAIRTWCERHGLLYIGHTLEEPVWGQARSQGNQTRVLQQFHYTGVDYLTSGIGTKDHPHRIVSVKTAASVAQLEGKERVVCESFGASGHAYSMRQRRLDANFMAFLGVNLFIPHAFYYSFAGYRKTDFPPTEFYHAPHWPHYRSFADYIGRLSLLGACTRRRPEMLIMSPIHTVYDRMFVSGLSDKHPACDRFFSLLSDRLLRHSLDFDYVDECQLREAEIVQGSGFRFTGQEDGYRILILPGLEVMSREIAARLVSFVSEGGVLIAVGAIPQHSECQRQDPEVMRHMDALFGASHHGVVNNVGKGAVAYFALGSADLNEAAGSGSDRNLEERCFENVCSLLRSILKRQPILSLDLTMGTHEDIVMVERYREDTPFIWLLNWSDQDVTVRVSSSDSRSNARYEWDLESGGVARMTDSAELRFAPGELRVISLQPDRGEDLADDRNDVKTDNRTGEQHAPDLRITGELPLGDSWLFRSHGPNVLLLDRWQVTLNDRESRMNATMPGQVNTYRTIFTVSAELIDWLREARGPNAQPSQTMLDSARSPTQPSIELILDDVEQRIPSHIGFLQRRRNIEIFVNGARQESLRPSRWQDPYYSAVDITPHLTEGENVLEVLTVSLLEPMPAVSYPAFLIGPFAAHGQRLTVQPELLSGDWCKAGYPYYAGIGGYSQQLSITDMDPATEEEIWLEAEDIRETARLYVNEHDAGVRLWPPYSWNVTSYIKQGDNVFRIEAANTLENLYGKKALPSGVLGQVKLVRRIAGSSSSS
ncbi:glycosyl hydrolase [Paenibacillus ihbetae]|uniref:Beta-galactosidase n=1 Tax=Paenibacillus ihbetae TaxID=1870820 RepID=A0ABX3JYR1_9BACL|nr:glycosyl hydrolase [Paenibacillus ihbetae]OOC61488.1 beta-galactosidase [Paenibacillus ihbetae]